ncbi:cobalamin biosynthesis protein CobD [Gloeothece citriformis PCC 7424]|uniref:Cobalamin biosynthesis protein CobD n=1 Tax=Gloeothece citriformis (strain PCC 7424) TaxID=65393 RepID=B7K8C3_GLOC7|nr:adenosylcobinamide-phosphate synthase CbiB [Gloeothece citriformis]ACK69883.1 cobalamin biosynthesis protein CobD [Gloeothece citriformis PCC 7424]
MGETFWYFREAIALVIAAGLDYLIGDPWGWLHPVQVMGWVISQLSEIILKYYQKTGVRRLAGVFLGLGLIIGSGVVGWGMIYLGNQINLLVGIILEIILLASCFAGRSLRGAAVDVLEPISSQELELARNKLSLYVGRDTDNLSVQEILRAVLETVAENTTDGVTAPLFYAIVGGLLPAIGIVPLTLAYKAASTLDSMIGYQREPYTDIGWFSAQLEDRLTWLPCRLTVLTLALISGKPRQVLSICRRDGVKDPSPNSGWSESVYAAILGVQLGGTNIYKGIIKHKPLLGDPIYPITCEKIYQALQLTRTCFLIWLGVAVFIYLVIARE